MKHTIDYKSDEHLSGAAKAFHQKLEDYSESITNDLAIVSTCLDPRVKISFIAPESKDSVIAKVRQYLIKVCPEDKDRSDSIQSQIDTSIYDQAYISDETDEVERYFASAREIRETNVINYWKAASSIYPNLQKLARILLCVQATSVASERAFSIAGHVDQPNRANLADDSFRSCILLDSWYDLLEQ